jgi:disulfide bond formation protein DsbB
MTKPTTAQIALFVGAVSAALILGALAFQYVGGYPPCEMCMWQRYPHFASILVGLGGGLLLAMGVLPAHLAKSIALLAILAIATTGLIGVYHAGVEWQLWKGPSACTGQAFQLTGALDLNAHVVSCDHAAWRLFGISMAGYNALISLGAAVFAAFALSRVER